MRFVVHAYGEIDSTNLAARQLASAGAAHGTVVTARRQSAGRGRHGRHWVSPAGNLYASFVLRPDVAARRAHEIGFVAALAVADTIDAILPDGGRAALKWPNDILLGGAKISGMLAEWGDDGSVVLGIGLNVVSAPGGLPYEATSLAAAGVRVNATAVLLSLIDSLAQWLERWRTYGFAPIRNVWLARGPVPGTPLVLQDGRLTGLFAGLDEDGALLLRVGETVQRVLSG